MPGVFGRIISSNKPLYTLEDSKVQEPGEISIETLEDLEAIVFEMPVKAKYSRKT